MKRLLLLLACLLALCTTVVAAEPAISDMKTDCTLTGSGFRAPGGEQFRLLVLPACRMTERLRAILARLTHAGVPVLRLTDPLLGEDDGTGAELLASPEVLPAAVRRHMLPVLTLGNAAGAVMLCRENENGRNILVVNTTDRELSCSASAELSGGVRIYDPLRDEVEEALDASSFRLTLEPYGARLLLSR